MDRKKLIYVFAPHPDDETLACGGTIATKAAQGRTIKVVVLTDGKGSHRSYDNPLLHTLAARREQESRAALALLGVRNGDITFLRHADRGLEASRQQAYDAILTLLIPDRERIEEVYFPHTYDSHPDHITTYEIVSEALDVLQYKGSRFMYMVWGETGDLFFSKRVVRDIAPVLELKKKAIQLYTSQIECIVPEQKEPNLTPSFLQALQKSTEVFFVYRNHLTAYHPLPSSQLFRPRDAHAERFTRIYQAAKWQKKETVSGVGSKVRYTRKIREVLQGIIDGHDGGNPLVITDLGCGDCNWMKEVNLRDSLYIGMDVVAGIICTNLVNYANTGMNFQLANIVEMDLPRSDYIICKDIFTHLPFADIHRVIDHIIASDSNYLLAYSDVETAANTDCKLGDWRRLNLTRPPFHFPEPEAWHREYLYKNSFAVWKISDLPAGPYS
ncbi:MAG: PIG-L family deacetylase [Desulfobulbaceae bacterium]|jgi:LmbE family N-acetylglucosaminyl deacetylase|nr:PIG-L family deacetylase [Desulfobulbaceae bacterium]MDY0352317.1 PIG-L family deacetylase [Desulfobulbaceae bacterium]